MLEKTSAKNQAPLSREAESSASGIPVMSPWGPIEVPGGGTGVIHDPPPGATDDWSPVATNPDAIA